MIVQVWRAKEVSMYTLILRKTIDNNLGKLLPPKSLTEAHYFNNLITKPPG
jgi:hypothetical protein